MKVPEGPPSCRRRRQSASRRRRCVTLDNLAPVNVCRVCVVEVDRLAGAGARLFASGGARHGRPDRHPPRAPRRARLVLELLASSVDLSLRRSAARGSPRTHRTDTTCIRTVWRSGRAPVAGERDGRGPGHHTPSPLETDAATVAQPTKIDNDLYMRDYSRCILCYKCVEACGVDAQNTYAIAVAGRGFDARISTESRPPSSGVGVRLLRQLHRRLSDRRADVQVGVRHARSRARGMRRSRR